MEFWESSEFLTGGHFLEGPRFGESEGRLWDWAV